MTIHWPFDSLEPFMRKLTDERICNDPLALYFFTRFNDRYVQTGPHTYVLHESATLARIVRIGDAADFSLAWRSARKQFRFWFLLELLFRAISPRDPNDKTGLRTH
jgi:hypothetical protein